MLGLDDESHSIRGGLVNVSTMRRMLGLVAAVGGGVVGGCSPAVGVSTMTPAEIESAIAAISWTGCATVARAAVPAGSTTNVEICASPGAREWGPRKAPPGNGSPVARMRNIGAHQEARWGLKPNNTYSIWLHSGITGETMYTIIGSGVNVTGPYHGCGHAPADSSRANFGTCAENPHPLAGGARSRGPSSSGELDKGEHTLLDRGTGPAWVSCTEGCCTTDAN